MSHKRTILIVDDQADIVEMIRTVLIADGYYVVTASDDEEGAKKLKDINPHLVILDMNMPNLAGINFYHHITNPQDGKPRYPVLVLTARTNFEALSKDLYVDGFMTKPFDISHLMKEVSSILTKRYGLSIPLPAIAKQGARKILVAEDDSNACDQFVIALVNAGYRVTVAKGAVAAFERAVHEDIDLALIKLDLPDLPGDILAAKLRQTPKTMRVSLIVYAGPAAKPDRVVANQICKRIGIKEVVETNEPHLLLKELEEIFEKKPDRLRV